MKGSAADVVNRAVMARERRQTQSYGNRQIMPQTPLAAAKPAQAPFEYLPIQDGQSPMFRDPPPLTPPARNPAIYKELMKKHDRMTSRHV